METINFRPIGLEDIKFGSSSFEVTLADGRVIVLNEVPDFGSTNLIYGVNDTPVSANASSMDITITAPSISYRVHVTPNWNTTYWITGKTKAVFTINFGTEAPSDGTGVLDIEVKA